MLAGRRSEFLARYEGRLALGAALVATILFGALALLRHWTFHSTASDLAVFDQVMWNTVHGRFMESTISLARCEPHSFFGDHFSPALLLLVPPYALFPHPETLIVAQTISLALGAWPIYLLARRSLPTSAQRLVWVAAYLLSAPLSFIALYDFHEITLAVAPLGFAMYFLATRRTVPMVLCLVLALLAKEEVALIGVGFGVALAFQGRWRSSAVVIAGSLVAFVVTLQVIIPAFAAGAPYQYLGRYASLGRDEGEIARTLLLDPLRVLSVLVKGEIGSKIVFVLSLFGPGLGLALRSKWALIPSLPPLGYLMLSDYGGEHTLHNQYGAPLIPLALGASILGVAALGERWRRRVTVGVLASSLFFAFSFGGLPFSLDFANAFLRGEPSRAPSGEPILARESRYEPFLAAVRAIPPEAAVSSRDFFTTQLPQRRFNYNLVGLDVCDAQYVILDYAAPSVNRDLAKHLAEVAAVEQLGFDEIASGQGLSLLRRR
ncbi:MAG: DUF2079 domain-containing protein [Chloroflexi bacterium]|nr:MAG: DUF2079 domain-containing protein [Chloroflexota bacterium]